jgi:hypothetical protein
MSVKLEVIRRLLEEKICCSLAECNRLFLQDAIKIDFKNEKIKIGKTKEISLNEEKNNDNK